MNHDEVREELEVAAVEPGGIDRLMAGDTVAAQAVAAHLAGCPSCSDELVRLRRASALVRDVLRTTVPPALRARTFAFVAAVGRDRSGVASAPRHDPNDGPASPTATGSTARRTRLGWIAAAAATIALAVVGTNLWLGTRMDTASQSIAALQRVTSATIELSAATDAARVSLVDTEGAGRSGTLLFSPSTTELVVVVRGLAAPPAGREYRCWVERAGRREKVGRMFFAGELAFWVGPVPAVAALASGTTFGVTLVDASAEALEGDPVLAGTLDEG